MPAVSTPTREPDETLLHQAGIEQRQGGLAECNGGSAVDDDWSGKTGGWRFGVQGERDLI